MKFCCLCQGLREAAYYIMGRGAGDWADYYCEGHLELGKKQLGPGAIVEQIASSGN